MTRRRVEVRQLVERTVTLQLDVAEGEEREAVTKAIPTDNPGMWAYPRVVEQSWYVKGEG